jgi:Lrp/AsnC family transcriptional regulator for asnA, asnC and gidA
MSNKIDDLDIQIIKELQKDARQSFRELAKKLKVAEGTVYNRANKLSKTGVIKGFIPDIDFSKLGYDLVALIGMAIDGGHMQEIEKKIAKEPNVSAVYDVTGEYDAVIVAKFRSRAELNDFIERILSMEYVKRTYTMVVLNVLKEQHGIRI